jgi:hypothetical protein
VSKLTTEEKLRALTEIERLALRVLEDDDVGHRSLMARGQVEAIVKAAEYARGFLLAASSGFISIPTPKKR